MKTFTTKLKLITNIESEDRSVKLGLNAAPPPNTAVEEFDQPMEKRDSLTEIDKSDQDFAPTKQPDESNGELAVNEGRHYKSLAIRIDRSIKESQLREQSVLDLWETLSEKQSLMNAIPNIRPARGWTTSKFGYRVSPFTGRPALHAGLDIAAAPGSPVYAPADGVVTFAGYDEGYGKMVSLDHGYGYSTRFGHNSQIYVQVGQHVSRWDIIASVGATPDVLRDPICIMNSASMVCHKLLPILSWTSPAAYWLYSAHFISEYFLKTTLASSPEVFANLSVKPPKSEDT